MRSKEELEKLLEQRTRTINDSINGVCTTTVNFLEKRTVYSKEHLYLLLIGFGLMLFGWTFDNCIYYVSYVGLSLFCYQLIHAIIRLLRSCNDQQRIRAAAAVAYHVQVQKQNIASQIGKAKGYLTDGNLKEAHKIINKLRKFKINL